MSNGQAVLTLPNCQRPWSGPVDIVVKNDFGEDTAQFNLSVVGKFLR